MAVLLLLGGCGAEPPDETAAAFWQAVQERDEETARHLLSEEVRKHAAMAPADPVQDFTLGEAEVEGGKAVVPVRLRFADGEQRVRTYLLLEAGEWKVRQFLPDLLPPSSTSAQTEDDAAVDDADSEDAGAAAAE